MKKFSLILVLILLSTVFFTGCSSVPEEKELIYGEWLLVGLSNYYTGEEYEYSDEIFIFNENGTGMEIYEPADYYEELSYTSWKMESGSPNVVRVKHSEEYIYDFNIVNITQNTLQCSYYYDSDPDNYYVATYERMQDGVSDYVGWWSYYEYYEDDEYYDIETYFLYLYPDGTMRNFYYEVQDEMSDTGTWKIDGAYLELSFDGYETTKFDTTISNNSLTLYNTESNGKRITQVYKRYYGLITNKPPATYPQNMWESINEYFSNIFKK